jgi:hypothetical protein
MKSDTTNKRQTQLSDSATSSPPQLSSLLQSLASLSSRPMRGVWRWAERLMD